MQDPLIPKCLLFDCDGTLVDSERICTNALVIMFSEKGANLNADEMFLRFRGWKLANLLSTLSLECGLELPKDFVDEYRLIISQMFEADLKPIDGIHAALDNLDLPKAVVSSGPVEKIRQTLRVCKLTDYFADNIYSAYEIGIWKPDPGIYEYAAHDMGFLAKDCMVIEDSLTGVEAGVRAGIRTLFYNRFDEPCAFEPVVSFNSMLDLPAIVRH